MHRCARHEEAKNRYGAQDACWRKLTDPLVQFFQGAAEGGSLTGQSFQRPSCGPALAPGSAPSVDVMAFLPGITFVFRNVLVLVYGRLQHLVLDFDKANDP